MSVFESCFLFLDNPNGGVEDIAYLKDKCPWIKGVFCNVRNYDSSKWEQIVRPRCLQHGLFCGPWGRTAKGPNDSEWDETVVDLIADVADDWDDAPSIVNSEKEIDGNNAALTYIDTRMGSRDYAISMQPIPFANNNWTIVGHVPILAQIMPIDQGGVTHDSLGVKELWHKYGVKCVYMTYGTYGGMKPSDFKLRASYSLFTGDVIMASYSVEKWAPTSTDWVACKQEGDEQVAVGVAASLSDAWVQLQSSSYGKAWKIKYPQEAQAILAYWNATDDVPPPENIVSKFGLALVALTDARKYAEGTHV